MQILHTFTFFSCTLFRLGQIIGFKLHLVQAFHIGLGEDIDKEETIELKADIDTWENNSEYLPTSVYLKNCLHMAFPIRYKAVL